LPTLPMLSLPPLHNNTNNAATHSVRPTEHTQGWFGRRVSGVGLQGHKV
jgi:hypothetical protein